PQLLGDVMSVFRADDRQGGRADDGVAAVQAYALVAIAAYGPRTARAVAEVLRQPVRLRPYLAHFPSHREHIAPPHGPPLLRAQAGAVEALAFVQGDAGPQPEVHQIAFARVVFFVDIAAQPLPGGDQGRHFETGRPADARLVVRRGQPPLGFIFHPAVARRLAFLAALPTQPHPAIVQPFDIGMLVQDADAILVAAARRRQIDIEKGA